MTNEGALGAMHDTPFLEEARILVVDDEPPNVSLLEGTLGRAGYLNVRATTDPRRVAGLVTEFEPDLILLDLHMPHLDGFGVMGQLSALISSNDYLPILVLTADITQEAKRRALAAGAKDFLTKPFDLAEVLLRIKNMLETRRLHLQLRMNNRELEERVRMRTEELERALVAEREAVQRLRELDDLKNAFLTSVSHELRTPLTSVLGGAMTMEQRRTGLSEEDQEGLIHGIATNARKLNRLLSDLLDIDRLARGIAEPIREPTDVAALIQGVLDEVALPGDRPVEVEAEEIIADIDAPKVERIVQNLLVNAARHTPPRTVRNLYRGCEAGEKATNDPRIRAALDAFDVEVPDAKDLRDVLEHFDAYLDGTGKLLHPEGTRPRDGRPENARDPWEGKRRRHAPPFSFGSWASYDQAAGWALIGAGELKVEVGAATEAATKLAAEALAALGQ